MTAGRLYVRAERLWREKQLGNENPDHSVIYKTSSSRMGLALGLQRVRCSHHSQVAQKLGAESITEANSKAVWPVPSRLTGGKETSQIRVVAAGGKGPVYPLPSDPLSNLTAFSRPPFYPGSLFHNPKKSCLHLGEKIT